MILFSNTIKDGDDICGVVTNSLAKKNDAGTVEPVGVEEGAMVFEFAAKKKESEDRQDKTKGERKESRKECCGERDSPGSNTSELTTRPGVTTTEPTGRREGRAPPVQALKAIRRRRNSRLNGPLAKPEQLTGVGKKILGMEQKRLLQFLRMTLLPIPNPKQKSVISLAGRISSELN